MKKRFRHHVTFFLFKPFLKLYARFRFGYRYSVYKPPKDLKGPYLIMSNHVLAFDPIFVSFSIRGPVFYVASDMIFSIPIASRFIKYLASPIPKTKYRSDLETIKDMKRMANSGGSIGLFPEGNATFHGELMPIPYATAKLLKFLKLPVLFYQIKGGYHVKPRWAKKVRKGKMTGSVTSVWRYEDYKDLSLDAIDAHIKESLKVNDLVHPQGLYKAKTRAEDIESSYFMCPVCETYDTVVSRNELFACKACGFEAEYSKTGTIEARHHMTDVNNTKVWYDRQLAHLEHKVQTLNDDEVLFEDKNEHVLSVVRSTKKTSLGYASMSLLKNTFKIQFSTHEEVWHTDLIKVAVQQKNKLIVHHTKLDKTYYFIGHEKRNALKYELAIKAMQTKSQL